jgi:Uma2 family endonuclease
MTLPAPRTTVLSVDAWIGLDEDVEGELVDGQLVEEEVASWAHELVVSWLIRVLGAWIVPRGGFVLGSESKLVIASDRGRKPDALVFFPNRPLPPRGASLSYRAPDIVVEVITATPRDQRRDRIDKKADYAILGVGQYWLIDPEARTFEVLTLDRHRRFVEVLAAAEGAHLVPGCDGLHLDLEALWSDLDRWASMQADEITDSGDL